MTITPNYKRKIISLPGENLLIHINEATRENFAVLMYVFSVDDFSIDEISDKLNITNKSVKESLDFWEKCGVIKCSSSRENDSAAEHASSGSVIAQGTEQSKPKASSHTARSDVPIYSADEIAEVLQNNKTIAETIDACQQIFGRLFNSHEVAVIVSLISSLNITCDYLLLLIQYAVEHDKKSIRFIESTCCNLYDNGITSYEALEEELKNREKARTFEQNLRDMMGIGKRTLTKKEREFFHTWSAVYSFGEDMISRAFEIAVQKTGNANVDYMNAILEKWYSGGIRTVEDVEKESKAYAEKKNNAAGQASSFVTDDFFEAALGRSYDLMTGMENHNAKK